MSSSVNFTVTGSSNSSSLVDGNGTITTSAAASNLSGKFYDGSVFGCCNFNEENLGIGPCFFICQFMLDYEYTRHLYLNDASWVEYLSLSRTATTRAGQELTAKTGVDVLTSVHYSAHGYDISNAGNQQVYNEQYINDFSNTGVIHVTHIYPSALDAYYVWVQMTKDMAEGRVFLAMQPWGGFGQPPGNGLPVRMSSNNYISVVNCPSSLLPKFQVFLNKDNGYSRMCPDTADNSGNLFRFNTTGSGVYRPEMAREGVFSELPPVALDGSGEDMITPANAYTGGAVAGAPHIGRPMEITDTIADIKLALPHMAAKVKDAVPPLANIQKL